MEAKKEMNTYITRDDINNFPFPYKIWLIVNSETCEFIRWNAEGTEILINVNALDAYLSTPKSIFRVKNRSSFIMYLHKYGFKKSLEAHRVENEQYDHLNISANYTEFVMYFKHENFLRSRKDLLQNVAMKNETSSTWGSDDAKEPPNIVEHLNEDLCFMSCGPLSEVHKMRIKHQTILNFQSESRVLQKKLLASEMISKNNIALDDETSVIELPVDLFENPQDSALYMGDENRLSYAGFYGNFNEQLIVNFFGDYLPTYQNFSEEDGGRRVADLNPPDRSPVKYEIDYSIVPDDSEQSPRTDSVKSPITPTIIESTFNHEQDEMEVDNKDQFYSDIIMSDIEFKKDDEQANPETEESELKIDVLRGDDSSDNDAFFKNFFSQYNESMKLVYDTP